MSDEAIALPPFRLVRPLIAVAIGGAVGTWIRAELTTSAPTMCSWIGYAPLSDRTFGVCHQPWRLVPWWLLVINTLGVLIAAFVLAGPLYHRSPDDIARLAVITGLLGGLTSYSALAQSISILNSSSAGSGWLLLASAVIAGVIAACAGWWIGRRWRS